VSASVTTVGALGRACWYTRAPWKAAWSWSAGGLLVQCPTSSWSKGGRQWEPAGAGVQAITGQNGKGGGGQGTAGGCVGSESCLAAALVALCSQSILEGFALRIGPFPLQLAWDPIPGGGRVGEEGEAGAGAGRSPRNSGTLSAPPPAGALGKESPL
jgi:hypothetical protein